ncbi:hypothetical protein APHAL10511_003558 [Amanita phalloides]|nr:hypothetical protein APHAL10511_003558 [Amanita phalloides]
MGCVLPHVGRQSRLYHPSATLISRPELAKHVRCITETGTVHFANRHLQPNITYDTVHALSLCTNLRSLTWSNDSLSTSYVAFWTPVFSNDNNSLSPSPNTGPASSIYHSTISQSHGTDLTHPLLLFLAAIKAAKAPLRELVIRSHSDLGPLVWSELSKWMGLTRIVIWCMEGPPRVLQGWARPELGKTLTDLELGRCAGVPPTILNSIFSQLPLLQHLCLKGVSPAAVLTILTFLPSLQTLDTEYLDSGSGNIWPRGWKIQVFSPGAPPPSLPPNDGDQASSPTSATAGRVLLPTLRNLTVRTSSIDNMGPNKLFTWIRALVTNPGLESLRLLTFTTSGNIAIPRGFILEMGRVHRGDTSPFNASPSENGAHSVNGGEGAISENGNERQMRKSGLCKWIVGQAQMTLADIECVCKSFPELEELACSVAVVMGHVDSIVDAISSANNMQTLRLQVQWIPPPLPHQYRKSSASHPPRVTSSHGRHALNMRDAATFDPDPIDLDPSDSEDGESDSEYDLAHMRFSGGSGARGVFRYDEAGMQRAMLNRYLDAFGPASSRPSYPQSPSRAGIGMNGHHNYGHHDHDSNHDGNGGGNGGGSGKGKRGNGGEMDNRPFTLDHARAMMLRAGSKLRVIVVGRVVYTGKWVWDVLEGGAEFKIECLGGDE